MEEEKKVGETFEYEGVKLIVRKMSPWTDCRMCFFFKEGNTACNGLQCESFKRKDKNYVYFEKVEEGR